MGLRGKELTVSQKECIVTLNYDGKNNLEFYLAWHKQVYSMKFFEEASNNRKQKKTENRRKGKYGRKSKSSDRTDRMLINVVKTNRRRSLSEITQDLMKVLH